MEQEAFRTEAGDPITAVTAAEMRAVDRVAVDEISLDVIQMMENAGRALASVVHDTTAGPVTVVAGNGGNGGGGLVCARHLANWGHDVTVDLDRKPESLTDAAAHQYKIVAEMDVATTVYSKSEGLDRDSTVIVDALIGYGLQGTVRESGARLIESMTEADATVVSLDVPSGIDATTGAVQGAAVSPDRTLTLVPKVGLRERPEPLSLVDISVPVTVYERLEIPNEPSFDGRTVVELEH